MQRQEEIEKQLSLLLERINRRKGGRKFHKSHHIVVLTYHQVLRLQHPYPGAVLSRVVMMSTVGARREKATWTTAYRGFIQKLTHPWNLCLVQITHSSDEETLPVSTIYLTNSHGEYLADEEELNNLFDTASSY